MEFIELLQGLQEAMPPEGAEFARWITLTLPYLTLAATLLTCFFGHKLHHIWLSFLFFCVGFLIGMIPSLFLTEKIPFYYYLALGLVLGTLAILLSRHLYRIHIFVVNAFLVYIALPNILEQFLPNGASILFGLIAAIAVGILAVRYKFIVTIVTTSISGAIASAVLLLQLFGVENLLLQWSITIFLSVGGLAVQYMLEREEIHQTHRQVKNKIQKVRNVFGRRSAEK